MILYHFNMGYPLLSEKAALHIPSAGVTPRNAHAASIQEKWQTIDPPRSGLEEACFYHQLRTDADGFAEVGLDNPAEGMGLRIRFDARALPCFIQWRMLGAGEYVMGLEPANAPIDGRAKARAEKRLPFLEPGEVRTYPFEIRVFDL